jgi:hypothetical protein
MLTTVESVIDALGGPTAAASLAGVGLSAVSNWKARNKFPSEMFLIFSDALAKNGNTPDPALFGFRSPAGEILEVRA